ncbi:hypothetical protein T06_3805 [Trichinella sp. T6]|nr:hypothetical protein T06_3805 [Trichinella sp. T6]
MSKCHRRIGSLRDCAFFTRKTIQQPNSSLLQGPQRVMIPDEVGCAIEEKSIFENEIGRGVLSNSTMHSPACSVRNIDFPVGGPRAPASRLYLAVLTDRSSPLVTFPNRKTAASRRQKLDIARSNKCSFSSEL